jgi:hypothetical protein
MSEPEPTPLYRDGRHYDLMNSDIGADIPFYVKEASREAKYGNFERAPFMSGAQKQVVVCADANGREPRSERV